MKQAAALSLGCFKITRHPIQKSARGVRCLRKGSLSLFAICVTGRRYSVKGVLGVMFITVEGLWSHVVFCLNICFQLRRDACTFASHMAARRWTLSRAGTGGGALSLPALHPRPSPRCCPANGGASSGPEEAAGRHSGASPPPLLPLVRRPEVGARGGEPPSSSPPPPQGMRSPRAMMRCWRGRPGLQALRGKSGAAGAREAERPAPSWGALPDLLAGRAPGRRRQQQQPPPGAPCGARDAAALQARSLLSRFFCSRAGDGAEGPRKPPAVERRSRAWEQSLSPLERLSRLVPEGCLTEAVEAVRSAEAAQETAVGATGTRRGPSPEPLLSATSGDVPFQAGELMVAEYRRRRRAVVRKLCRLTAGGVLQSSWGTLPFAHVLGRLPGQLLLTSIGQPFLVRRPSLEDYVLLMKRGPAIAYPKLGH
ncbi:tRNA (adenine(58)-N(1))-methyltransferase, mitochondrial isoform X2 [Paroedura picta]|uniref:tRNA (adenine(58)-N(1))-methyltransferase, mitochondrial isoform X2 n=1 Tax=Paroedura picta TaxID=143630 RepID=UPI004056C057